MIQLLRVDHRLLHGQVVFSWCKTDKYSLMIVTGNVKDAVRLARETTQIRSINLGGTKAAPDRHALSPTVYVSDEEEKLLHEAAAEGIEVFIQVVPSDAKKILT